MLESQRVEVGRMLCSHGVQPLVSLRIGTLAIGGPLRSEVVQP